MGVESPSSRWAHTGAILAGGLSTRMGGSKAALLLGDGRAMIDHVRDALAGVCRQVVVVGPCHPDQPGSEGEIADLRPAAGPLGGLEALLASGVDHEYLVVPCDQPFIGAALLRLLTRPSSCMMSVLRVEDEDAARPLPARISAAALETVRGLLDSGRSAVWQLAEAVDAEIISCPASLAGGLRDINTPEALDEALRLQAARVRAPLD